MLTLKNRSFKITILLLAIAHLFCGHVSAMERALVKDQKDHKKQVPEVLMPPLSTCQFKQLFVPLSSTSANTFPLVFDHPHENLIINYQLAGSPIAQLVCIDKMMRFESQDPKGYDFLLENVLKTGALTIATQGSFTFQKPVKTESASLTCKSVEFLDKFSSEKGLTLDVNYCDNSGDVTCADMLFRGDQFNALSGSTLNIQGTAALLAAQGLFNDGKISCAQKALINTPLLENWGILKAGNLRLDGENILNEGLVDIEDFFLGECKIFDHRGKMDVHNDCVLEKVGKFSTARSSSWKVGGDWKAYIEHLNLEGNSVVGNSALFTIGLHAILSGLFKAPILFVDSKDLITCNYTAKLFATHYIGLKAKGWMQFEGDVFKTFVQASAPANPSQRLEALLEMFPKGVFLHSEQSGIKKSGSIIEKNGTVSLEAKKGLIHTGLTEAGFGLDSSLSMTGASLFLEKESILQALNARLTAQSFIDQLGTTDIKQHLAMEALKITHSGSLQAGSLSAKGDTILATESSHIAIEKGSFDAQDKIVNAGTLTASEQLDMKSQNITLETTSDISAKNVQLKAVETLDNQGNITVSDSLLARAKFVENSGIIAAKNVHIKADRLWWNKKAGTVIAEDGLTIDALVSMNTLGLMQANNLTINAGVDLNLLGVYRAKSTSINALVGLNAGICIPKFDSLDELITYDNAWKAGEGLLNKYVPTAGVVYVLGKNIVGIYQQKSIYHQGKKLYEQAKDVYEQEDTGASDWIFLVCEAKNLTTSAIQTGKTVQQGYQIACPLQGNTNSSEKKNDSNSSEEAKTDAEIPKPQPINWADVACQATVSLVSTLGPQINRDTLIDLNYGATLGVNGNSRSMYNANSGVSVFANKHTIDTDYGVNVGVLAASDLNVQATKTYNSPGAVVGINAAIKATDLQVDGEVGAINARLTAQNSIEQSGTTYISKQFVMEAPEIILDKTSHISAESAQIKSDKPLNSQGDLNISKQLVMEAPEIIYSNSVRAGGLFAKANNISLTVSSQTAIGNGSFEAKEKIDNAGTLTASEHLDMKAQDITLAKTSHISAESAQIKSAKPLNSQGDLNISKQLVMEAPEIIYSNSVRAGGLFAKANNISLTVSSQTAIGNGSFEAKEKIDNAGTLTASEHLDMKAQNIALDKTSHVSAKTSQIKADELLDSQGHLNISEKLVMEASKIIYDGSLQAKILVAKANNISLTVSSQTAIGNGSFEAKEKIDNAGTLTASEHLDMKAQNITLAKTSHVSAKTAQIKADEKIDNQGDLRASETLFAHAKYVENSGVIGAKDAHIKADRWWRNKSDHWWWSQSSGIVDVEDSLTIDALFSTNTFGSIHANHLTVNAGIDLNLFGKYSAETSHINALIGLNGGMYIPKFNSNSWSKRFTKRNAWSAGVSLLGKVSPVAGLVCSLGTTIYNICEKDGLWDQGVKLYDHAGKLYANKEAGASDWIVVACGAKNIAMPIVMSTLQAATLAKQGYEILNTNNASDVVSTLEAKPQMPLATIANVAYQTASTLTSSFGPQASRDTLIDLNCGVMLGINGSSRSICNLNTGASLFANSYSVDTACGANNGLLVTPELSVKSATTYTSTGTVAGINASMVANDLNVNRNVRALNNINLTAHNKANLDADISARNVGIQAKKSLKLGAESTIHGGNVTVDTASLRGDADNKISSTNQTRIRTAHLDNQGSTTGALALEFNGEANQLKSIGSIDTLRYIGTLENNIADTLANGHNALLSVAENGAVIIDAQEQNVHLKEQHDTSHALCVQTRASIQCDKDLLSGKSIWLQAEGDIQHASVKSKEITGLIGKNISSEGHVTRESSGENYTDRCTTSKVSGNQVIIKTTGDLEYKGTDVHSGIGGTQLFVGNRLIADALTVEEYNKSEQSDAGTTWATTTTTKDKTTTSIPCTFTSDGATTGYVNNVAELHSTVFASKDGTNIKATIEDVPTYNTHTHQEETKQTGYYNGITKSESSSQSCNPITFNDESPAVISSDNPVSIHLTGSTPSITINAPQVEVLVTKKTTETTCSEDGIYVGLWDKKTQEQSRNVTTGDSYSGIINTNAQVVNVEEIKHNPPVIINTVDENAHITRSLFEDLHQHQKISSQRPTRAASIAIAMAVTMLTSGLGASAGGAMATTIGCKTALSTAAVTNITASAITSLSVQVTDALLKCNGDLPAAAKVIASNQTLKNMVLSAGTAGAVAGAGELLNQVGLPAVKDAHNLSERLMYAAPRQAVNAAIKTGANVIAGQEVKDAAKQNLRSALASTIGIACTSQIGDAYAKEQIDPISHKLLHTGAGAIEGAILGGVNGAMAGGMSALVTETVADLLSPKMPLPLNIAIIEEELGRPLNYEEFTQVWNHEVATYLQGVATTADVSKLAAVSVALLTRQDIDITNTISATALDNNFLVLASTGMIAAGVGYSAYQINNAYQEGGPEAALKQLGIEVGMYVVGAGVVKVGFKVGCVMYPSARVAVAAVLETTPGLKFALGELAEVITLSCEVLGKSALGKTVSAIEVSLVNTTNEVTKKIGNYGANLEANVAENLVEHVVPTSVLNTVEKQLVGKAAKEGAKQLALPAPDKLLSLPSPDKLLQLPAPEKALLLPAPDKLLSLPAPEKLLQLPAPVVNEIIKESSGKIKSFPVFDEKLASHIFSDKHKTNGILDLGPTKEAINDKFVAIIKEADIKNLLQEGPNNIVTKINGKEVTIRAFIKNDDVLNYNGFIGPSSRKVDNKFYL